MPTELPKIAGAVANPLGLKRADFISDQEVRWCPGCGDYSILFQVQTVVPKLNIPPENLVFVSGIGCSSRFPYYMETYGFHSIHGRAPTIATGIKTANPKLSVWVVTGDGDGLSIGGNHFIHLMRRNVDLNVMLFNNRIYGLTKGQYSPTSEFGKRTKSSPQGTIEQPINPVNVALASGATFVARSVDVDTRHLAATVERAAYHKGTSFVEIYQNCNIFNDGAFKGFTEKDVRFIAKQGFDHIR
ncbi:MAG TPA: 2-oxoacid:ferredoxin oxidoreductase subunit beta, partial [Acidobacteriota bacterium]|nr:2-oxoacid:ferredoxin oxidoreductase subunit beta [Acidobacteriota bacterium]